MSTGLLLFLVFLALSIIDSVARGRRSQQQQAALPPGEDEDDWPAEAPSVESGEEETREKRARGSSDEFLDLEKLMGSGYLERLMGPGFADVAEEGEEDVPRTPAAGAPQAPTPQAGPSASRERESPAAAREREPSRHDDRIAREGRTPDQERRRAEARRRQTGVGLPSEAEGQRPRDLRLQPGVDRRLPDREDTGSRPARVARKAVALQDSAVGRDRPDRDSLAPMPGGAPRPERPAPRRTRLYRDLFGDGGRDSLRRAFVLKEILDAPASERRQDPREGG